MCQVSSEKASEVCLYFFIGIKLRGGGDDIFFAQDQVKVYEKHFAVGTTCKLYKGTLVSFEKYNDIPIAFKESAVAVTRGTKRSIQKEVELFRQLDHKNVIKSYGIEKSR